MAKKTYTVSTVLGTYAPSIKLTGKWLNEIGLNVGDQLELIESRNMIILMKIPKTKIIQQQKNKQIALLTKELNKLTN